MSDLTELYTIYKLAETNYKSAYKEAYATTRHSYQADRLVQEVYRTACKAAAAYEAEYSYCYELLTRELK